MRERVVFIGGSILPLLQTDHLVFGSPRPTKDVDGVVVTQRYTDKAAIEDRLRELLFHQDMGTKGHVDKWKAPDGTTFDLVSCGTHTGATGNAHDLFAIETSVSLNLPPRIRRASAVGFLVLKCGAFHDRGRKVPLQSKDLADILALVATRPELPTEFAQVETAAHQFAREEIGKMLQVPSIIAAIPTHIRDREPLVDNVYEQVMAAMHAIATGSPGSAP